MFDSFYKKSKESESVSNQKLKQITDILFPEYLTRVTKDGSKYSIDSSVDINLDTVLQDLHDGFIDEMSIETLSICIKKIMQVRDVLKAHRNIDTESSYYIISMIGEKLDVDSIVPADEPV